MAQSADGFTVDLETRNVSHESGWTFRVVPSMGLNDSFEIVCIAHPSPVTQELADKAPEVALGAHQAFQQALKARH